MGQPREFEEARKTAQAELKRMDEIKKMRQTEMDNLPEAEKRALEENLKQAEANAKGKRLRLSIKLTATGYCWKVEHLGLSNPGRIILVIETLNEETKGQETASRSIEITQIEKGSTTASILASSAVARLSPKPEDDEALARRTRNQWMVEACVDKMEALPPAMFARGPVNIPIQVGFWNAVVNPASLATPEVRDLINWLRADYSNTITILGWFSDAPGAPDPLTSVYPRAMRDANRIPSTVINPIDYIFVKANNVRGILISMGAPAAQINVPAKSSLTPAQMRRRIVIGDPARASTVQII